ncbi:MAG: hypothetical protein K2N13_04050 [Paraprevotella sp.]|nr:hypothetical protein [Paraprevotella sp.]
MKKIKLVVGGIAVSCILALNFDYANKGYGLKNVLRITKATEAIIETGPNSDWYDYILFPFYTQISKKVTQKSCPSASITSTTTTTTTTSGSGEVNSEVSASATDGITTVNTSMGANVSTGASSTTTTTTKAEYELPERMVDVVDCVNVLTANDDCTPTIGDPCNPANR